MIRCFAVSTFALLCSKPVDKRLFQTRRWLWPNSSRKETLPVRRLAKLSHLAERCWLRVLALGPGKEPRLSFQPLPKPWQAHRQERASKGLIVPRCLPIPGLNKKRRESVLTSRGVCRRSHYLHGGLFVFRAACQGAILARRSVVDLGLKCIASRPALFNLRLGHSIDEGRVLTSVEPHHNQPVAAAVSSRLDGNVRCARKSPLDDLHVFFERHVICLSRFDP